MIKKGQLYGPRGRALSAADQFYSLAIQSSNAVPGFAWPDVLIATELCRGGFAGRDPYGWFVCAVCAANLGAPFMNRHPLPLRLAFQEQECDAPGVPPALQVTGRGTSARAPCNEPSKGPSTGSRSAPGREVCPGFCGPLAMLTASRRNGAHLPGKANQGRGQRS